MTSPNEKILILVELDSVNQEYASFVFPRMMSSINSEAAGSQAVVPRKIWEAWNRPLKLTIGVYDL